MKLAHIIILTAGNKLITLCGKLYIPAAIESSQKGVYAQKCPGCVQAQLEANWLTITPRV